MSKTLGHQDVVMLLKKRQGKRSNAAFARELGISGQYLADIYSARYKIGPSVLDKLGMTQEMRYRPARKAKARKKPK